MLVLAIRWLEKRRHARAAFMHGWELQLSDFTGRFLIGMAFISDIWGILLLLYA